MGNTWTGVSDEKLEAREKVMLAHSGIPYEQFDIQNVVIDQDGNYIRTYQVGDRTKQTMVLMHGYGGSCVMFWRIMKPLAEKYHLIMIDILGMGGSSRPDFLAKCKTHEEADEFFIDWLELWRQKMGDLKDFVLAGHSFGGYVCGLYASRYHRYVKKLLMLSPAGVPKYPEGFDINKEFEKFPKHRRPPKFALKLVPKVWKKQWSPFGVMRKAGRFCVPLLLRNYAKNRLSGVTG